MAEAFARGCDGLITYNNMYLSAKAHVFYGVQPETSDIFWRVRESGEDWYYIDNGYFHGYYHGSKYYRVTRNALQYQPFKPFPNMTRWSKLGLDVKILPPGGAHILLCPPREYWMTHTEKKNYREWLDRTVEKIKKFTDRPIRIRWKPKSNKDFKQDTSKNALSNAWCVVTYMSNIAVEATLRGLPVFTDDRHCCAPVGNLDLRGIEDPFVASHYERQVWAADLSRRQWTMAEIESGLAWKMLNEGL